MTISVCIVTYNQEDYVEQCIRSVTMQQTTHDLEIVIGDDHSTDRTPEILAELEREFPHVLRIIPRKQNLGPGLNFERTLAECNGDFVAFLEGDNFWTHPEKLQRQADLLEAHPDLVFVFHRTRNLYEGEVVPEELIPAEDFPQISGIDILFQDNNPVPFGSMLVRRANIGELAEWTRGLKLGDWPLCMMLARHGGIGYIPEEMSRQRIHDGGVWTRLAPHVRVIYIMQMFQRVVGLLEGTPRDLAQGRLDALVDYWASEVMAGKVPDLDTPRTVLEQMDAPELTEKLVWATIRCGIDEAEFHRSQAKNYIALHSQTEEQVQRSHEQLSNAQEIVMRLTAKIEGLESKKLSNRLLKLFGQK